MGTYKYDVILCFISRYDNIFFMDVAKTMSTIHEKYVVVPADKAQNNIVFICKKYYIECLLSEIDQDQTNNNQTYKETTPSKQEIIDNKTKQNKTKQNKT